MFLEKATFPVALVLSEAQEKVAALLAQKGWKNYYFSSSKLVYVPFWFFSYDIFSEASGKPEHLSSGKKALNAFSKEFNETLGSMDHTSSARETQASTGYEVEVLKPMLSGKEAKDFILLKIASLEKTPKQNVMLSGLEMLYIPFFHISVSLDEETKTVMLNALSGEILSGQEIPERRPKSSEVFAEAISDFSTLQGWQNFFSETISGLSGSPEKEQHGKNKQDAGTNAPANLFGVNPAVIALAVIAIIVVLWFFYAS